MNRAAAANEGGVNNYWVGKTWLKFIQKCSLKSMALIILCFALVCLKYQKSPQTYIQQIIIIDPRVMIIYEQLGLMNANSLILPNAWEMSVPAYGRRISIPPG